MSSKVDISMNLPAGDPYITDAPGNFDQTDPATFNNSTSITIFDSLGDSHVMTYYFIKDNPTVTPNEWFVFTAVDGQMLPLASNTAVQAAAQAVATAAQTALTTAEALVVTEEANAAAAQVAYDAIAVPVPGDLTTLNAALATRDAAIVSRDAARTALTLANRDVAPIGGSVSGPLSAGGGSAGAKLIFNSSGDLIEQTPKIVNGGLISVPLGANILTNGADPLQTIAVDFNLDTAGPNVNEPTQFASNFEVTALQQDGLAVGRLTGLGIDTDGLIRATYSNGTSEPLARVAMVDFANEQGLTQVGSSSWKESILSGSALAGEAGSGTLGSINSSALEQSNVNLTAELIDLIAAQRNFQANSRALEVDNQLNQTILQIR
jgi:flagellar hook protein FlgE